MIFDSQDKIVEVVAEQNRLMMMQGDVEYNPATHEYEYRPISSNPSIQRKYAQFRNRL